MSSSPSVGCLEMSFALHRRRIVSPAFHPVQRWTVGLGGLGTWFTSPTFTSWYVSLNDGGIAHCCARVTCTPRTFTKQFVKVPDPEEKKGKSTKNNPAGSPVQYASTTSNPEPWPYFVALRLVWRTLGKSIKNDPCVPSSASSASAFGSRAPTRCPASRRT